MNNEIANIGIALGVVVYIFDRAKTYFKKEPKEQPFDQEAGFPLKAPGGFTHDQCPMNPSIMTTLTKLSVLSDTTITSLAELKTLTMANHKETKELFEEVWVRLRTVEDTASIGKVEIQHLKDRLK